MRVVRDDPQDPDPCFAELYAALPLETDLEPWLGLARVATPPVLYLGIGAGRLAVPLARAGVEIVGVDAHPLMLETLRERLPDLRALQARIEDLQLRERFELVIAPSHLLSSKARLDAAARHLASGGRLALELMNPHWLAARGDPQVRVRGLDHERAEIEVDYPTGHTHVAEVALVWPEEVDRFLEGSGLRLEHLLGGKSLAASATYFAVATPLRADRPRSGSSGSRSR